MSDKPLERPRQVTFAAALIMGGSALIVASVFERIAGLGTLETQQTIDTFLSEPPGDGLGLSATSVETILRVLSMVAGATATATAILGFHVLKRTRSARLGLAVLALPLFISGMAVGGFLASLVVASSVMLWFQPAKDWFDGVVRRPADAERTVGPGAGRAGQHVAPPPPPTGPRAVQGFGSAPSATATLPARHQASAPERPAARPSAVLWACLVTWSVCGLGMIFMALSVLTLIAVPDLVFDEIDRQSPDLAAEGLSRSSIITGTYVSAAVVLLWGAAAVTFAVLAFRRTAWGRTALMICAGVAGVVCLVGSLFSIVLALPFVACTATFALLMRPEVRAWFA
ncbi:hypothetical protein [Nocardioides psychrotolerans]|uniref:DUF4064 domain-containing protein n=1 Tax=Nocardioides psychrotolerans TaxID=1005945 RepID=A0A1I3PTX6_9ACTN|nr:hypothetical protein [Nocardioides psychrotolerans]SFJ24919.1 hypothetical protein SAMN05216561_12213 [Nocardioides psychrotolerans]